MRGFKGEWSSKPLASLFTRDQIQYKSMGEGTKKKIKQADDGDVADDVIACAAADCQLYSYPHWSLYSCQPPLLWRYVGSVGRRLLSIYLA